MKFDAERVQYVFDFLGVVVAVWPLGRHLVIFSYPLSHVLKLWVIADKTYRLNQCQISHQARSTYSTVLDIFCKFFSGLNDNNLGWYTVNKVLIRWNIFRF